jgi:hypothetical protein
MYEEISHEMMPLFPVFYPVEGPGTFRLSEKK